MDGQKWNRMRPSSEPFDESSQSPFELDSPRVAEPQSNTETEFENPFKNLTVPVSTQVKQVWAVASGKGGVGKSLVSSNLAISLARMGYQVVAIDLDLGGANLHTALGAGLPKKTLGDFFGGRTDSLQDCVSPSGIRNLSIVSGAQDSTAVANVGYEAKVKLFESVKNLDADYVIFDLGAGTTKNTVDFFLYADLGILVLLPEPTSIENAYRFIKSAYFRKLSLSHRLRSVSNLIDAAKDSKNNLDIKTPADLFKEVNKTHPEAGMYLKEEIEKFTLRLIVNQARTQTDVDIGFSVKSVCKKYFGIDVDFMGYLDYDPSVWQAVRRKRPLSLEFPNSPLVASIERISNYLVKRLQDIRSTLY